MGPTSGDLSDCLRPGVQHVGGRVCPVGARRGMGCVCCGACGRLILFGRAWIVQHWPGRPSGPGGEWVAVCVLQSGCGLCPTLARRGTRLWLLVAALVWRPGGGLVLDSNTAWPSGPGGEWCRRGQQWMVDCFQPGCSGWGRARPVRSATKSRTAETVETGLPHLAQVRTVLGGVVPAAKQYDCVWPHGPPPSTRM